MSFAAKASVRTFVVCLGILTGFCLAPSPAWADVPFDQLLPRDTIALARISDFRDLRARWNASQWGRLLADPQMKPFIDSVHASLDEVGAELQKQAGLSFQELLDLPHGEFALGMRGPADEQENSPRLVLLLNVGPNLDKARELLDRLTAKLVDAGYVRGGDEVQGTALTVLEPPEPQGENSQWPPVIWGTRDNVVIACTDRQTIAEVLGRWDGGAEDSLAKKPPYQKIVERTGENAQVHFYLDVSALISLATKSIPLGPAAGAGPQVGQILQLLGLDSLQSVGASMGLNQGQYDSLLKLLVHYETPPRGLVRAIHFRSSELVPEPWVPPDVVSYTTLNFDLGQLLTIVDETVSMFQPGGLSGIAQLILSQQGITLDVKRELIAPIAGRFTVVSDYAKPGDISSQRSLYAVALNDPKVIEATLGKLAPLGGGVIKERDFRGQTIYEITIPANLFGLGEAGAPAPKMGICVAQSCLMFASDVTPMEKILLQADGQKDQLGNTAAYRQVVRHMPTELGGVSFSRTAEVYRALYAMLKSGALGQGLRGALAALPSAPAWIDRLADALEGSNLPEFNVVERYLGSQGMYLMADQDGLLLVQFQLRHE